MSVVGFWENACAALLALATLAVTLPTMTGKAEVCTALELAIDGPRVTELGGVTVGGTGADEDAEDDVVACGAPADEEEEYAELDAIGGALLDGETGGLGVDDGATTLDEGKTVEEATLLDVICMTDGVLEAALLLGVTVAVQYSCGTTL